MAEEPIEAPSAFLMMLEARAPWEFAAMMAAVPWLARMPLGDGHPVLVFPGLGASDITTLPLRNFLHDRGYSPHEWKQGINLGPRRGVLDACRQRLCDIHDRHGCKVSLLGWSLGGLYARELAKEMPDRVRCVITLGTPFAGHPRATNAWRVYEMLSGQSVSEDAELVERIRQPPSVPTTSIYSKTDGIVAWQCSINPDEHANTENIEVHASHVGMGMNPLAMYAIADRLRQAPERWQRFDVQGARRWFFKGGASAPARG